MKAVVLIPRKPDSLYLGELPSPSVDSVPDGQGVLVKVLRVGLCGTDREMQAGEYGALPPGYEFWVLGHESFGVVESVGSEATSLYMGKKIPLAGVAHQNGPLRYCSESRSYNRSQRPTCW